MGFLDYSAVLKAARERRNLTQEQLSEKAGLGKRGPRYISQIENGDLKVPGSDKWVPICAALGVDPSSGQDIPSGEMPPVHFGRPRIPIIELSEAGIDAAKAHSVAKGGGPKDGAGFIHGLPDILDPRAFAVVVRGDRMAPRYLDGQVVIVDTTARVGNGDFVVAGLGTGERHIARWKQARGKVLLEFANPAFKAAEARPAKVEFAFKIVWVKEA